MKYSIIISTAPRPGGVNYLEQTVQSLARGGVFQSSLLGFFQVCHAGERTIHENMIRCLEEADRTRTEWTIIMADDILVCGEFLESVDQWLKDCSTPEIAFYPLGANFGSVEHPQVACRYLTRDFYGAQCLCIHHSRTRSLADRLKASPTLSLPDIQIGVWANAVGSHYVLTPCPSFIQHIGRVSTQPNVFFDFPSWQGEAWTYTSQSGVCSPGGLPGRQPVCQ